MYSRLKIRILISIVNSLYLQVIEGIYLLKKNVQKTTLNPTPSPPKKNQQQNKTHFSNTCNEVRSKHLTCFFWVRLWLGKASWPHLHDIMLISEKDILTSDLNLWDWQYEQYLIPVSEIHINLFDRHIYTITRKPILDVNLSDWYLIFWHNNHTALSRISISEMYIDIRYQPVWWRKMISSRNIFISYMNSF